MKKYKIGIVGKGYVGNALGKLLERKYKIVYYDKFIERYKNPVVLKNCKAIFICVSTPNLVSGQADISAVEEVVKLCPDTLIIIKSSVIPGTTDRLAKKYKKEIFFNPEFLRQNYAIEDMKTPHKLIITDKRIAKIYEGLVNCPLLFMNNKTAEMCKYANNVMLAGQIGIANEIYQICNLFNIDYDKVKESMLLDKRIGRNISVPGWDKKLGFDGACLSKDLNAITYLSNKLGYKSHLLEELYRSNLRNKNR